MGRFKFTNLLCFLGICVCCVSCETERTVIDSDVNKGFLAKFDNFHVAKGADGTYSMQSDKRSDFEKKAFGGFNGAKDQSKKEWNDESKSVSKKEWDGGKTVAKKPSDISLDEDFKGRNKSYAREDSSLGRKSYDDTPEFHRKEAKVSREKWYASNRQFEKDSYSQENKESDIDMNIMSVREYGQKTIEEVNSMLGRSKDK